MNRLITILIIASIPSFLYGQDIPFMDGAMTNQKKADQYYNQMAYNQALKYYAKALEKSPENESLKLRLAQCYTQLRDKNGARKYYETSIIITEATGQDTVNYADALSAMGEYEKAQKWYEAYLVKKPNDNIILRKKEDLKHIDKFFEDSMAYHIKLAAFNSEKADFSPTYWNKQTFFVSNRKQKGFLQFTDGRNGDGFLDIYQWENEKVVRFDAFNKGLHEGSLSFFEEGNMVVVTTNQKESTGIKDVSITSKLKLVIYKQAEGKWQYESEFPYNNTEYSVGHPSFDQVNQVMYFASNMPGGKGGVDLYVTRYNKGEWSEPKNLESLNTQGDELFPFISTTGDLYFSSNGLGGLGGLDLYKANMSSPNSSASNLGYPINTPDDDFGLTLDETGTKGYISSNRKNGIGNDDIYELTIFKIRVEAKLVDKETKAPVAGKIRIIDQRTGKEEPLVSEGEKVVFNALKGRPYKIIAESEGYGNQEMAFETKTTESFVSVDVPIIKNPMVEVEKKEIAGVSAEISKTPSDANKTGAETIQIFNLSKSVTYQIMPDEMLVEVKDDNSLKEGSPLEIKNIYFKFDSDEIRAGEEELKKLSDLLAKHQTINVIITAYCDSYGSLKYNDKLSKKRIRKILGYLSQQGIADARVQSSPVGNRQLFNACPHPDNCKVEAHQQNRRVEFVLISGKKL